MTPEQIKTIFLDEISSLLGIYKVGEKVLPAVWIGKPPTMVDRVGLELLIPLYPLSSPLRGNIIQSTWELVLIQNNLEASTQQIKIHSALQKISTIPGVINTNFIPAMNLGKSPNYQLLDTANITYVDFYPSRIKNLFRVL
jgi:hypothetical protein